MKHKLKTVNDQDILNWLKNDRVISLKPYVPLKQHKDTFVSTTLDCHGYTVQQSFIKIFEFIEKHYYLNNKKIVIITGKSGKINQEFPQWMSENKFVRYFQILNNKGSWKVVLRKN